MPGRGDRMEQFLGNFIAVGIGHNVCYEGGHCKRQRRSEWVSSSNKAILSWQNGTEHSLRRVNSRSAPFSRMRHWVMTKRHTEKQHAKKTARLKQHASEQHGVKRARRQNNTGENRALQNSTTTKQHQNRRREDRTGQNSACQNTTASKQHNEKTAMEKIAGVSPARRQNSTTKKQHWTK